MDYKQEMKKLMKQRDEYFPLFDFFLGIYGKREEFEFPLEIEGAARIALVLELVDIGYIEKESLIVKKNRGDITGLYYNGGYPLTEKGILAHRGHLHMMRVRYLKLIALAAFVLLSTVLYFLIF